MMKTQSHSHSLKLPLFYWCQFFDPEDGLRLYNWHAPAAVLGNQTPLVCIYISRNSWSWRWYLMATLVIVSRSSDDLCAYIPSRTCGLLMAGPTARWYNNRKGSHIAHCAKPECVTPQQGDVCDSQKCKSICYHKRVKSPLDFVYVSDSRHWSWFGWRDRRGAPGSTWGTTCCGTWTWCHQHRKSSLSIPYLHSLYINIMWPQILYIAVSLALALLSVYICFRARAMDKDRGTCWNLACLEMAMRSLRGEILIE